MPVKCALGEQWLAWEVSDAASTRRRQASGHRKGIQGHEVVPYPQSAQNPAAYGDLFFFNFYLFMIVTER